MFTVNQTIQVLLVHHSDDIYTLTDNLLRVIPKQPFRLSRCATIEEARQRLKKSLADIVLLDDALIDGDTLYWIQQEERPQPVIVLAGHENETSCAQIFAQAPDSFSYLFKRDLSASLLDRSIRQALQQNRLQQALTETACSKEMLLDALHHRIRPSVFAENLILTQFLEGYYGSLDTQQTSMLTELLKSNRITALLLENIEEFHRRDESASKGPFESVNINDLIRRLVQEEYASLNDNKHHQLCLDLDETIPPFHCNPGRLEQALRNVILNALWYTPKYGRIDIQTRLDDHDHWVFSIKDNGPGIPEDMVPALFEPCQNQSVEYRLRGTGLGLYSARKIIQSHEGEFRFSNTPDGGCACQFSLPVK